MHYRGGFREKERRKTICFCGQITEILRSYHTIFPELNRVSCIPLLHAEKVPFHSFMPSTYTHLGTGTPTYIRHCPAQDSIFSQRNVINKGLQYTSEENLVQVEGGAIQHGEQLAQHSLA